MVRAMPASTSTGPFRREPNGVVVPTYETSPLVYPDFGADQGWDRHHNFQTMGIDIVGFGDAGMFVAPYAFLPEAHAGGVPKYFAGNSAAEYFGPPPACASGRNAYGAT